MKDHAMMTLKGYFGHHLGIKPSSISGLPVS